MEKISAFLRRKDIVFSPKRYFIDAMSAMAQGLFCTLLVGTILNTLGTQLHIGFLTDIIVTLGKATARWATPSAACARPWWARVWPWPSGRR